MYEDRFGSYSRRSTFATMPSLSRRKSIIRSLCLWPDPLWRVVRRPTLLRPPVDLWPATRARTGLPRCRCERSGRSWKRVPGEVGLSCFIAMSLTLHCSRASRTLAAAQFDLLPLGEAHVGLFPVLAAAERAAEPLHLARLVDDVHGVHLHLEHVLDRGADLRLRGVAAHAEHVLVALGRDARGLLRHVRRDHDAGQAVLRITAHASFSSSMRSAPTVASTFG